MSTLVIAEKPDMARKIADVIVGSNGQRKKGYIAGNGYIVTWAVGHLVGLAPPSMYDDIYATWSLDTLPILPEQFQMIVDPRKMDRMNDIRRFADRANVLVNACDAGREGQYIFDLIYRHLRLNHPVKRLWLQSPTENGIKKAFQSLKNNNEYEPLFEAADARSKADWLVGINGTRALSVRHEGKLSVGRVQTPTLSIVYDRDKEIASFQSVTHYEINATFQQGEESYRGKLHTQDYLTDREEAEKIQKEIEGKQGNITYYTINKGKESAPKLFDLTSLQSEANKKYGFTLQQTLNLAQSLYEKHEAITYPRTDSKYVTEEEIPMMHDVFERAKSYYLQQGFTWVKEAKKEIITTSCRRVCNPSKVTDHHALLPTEKVPTGDRLSEDEKKIYQMIVERFLIQFFSPALYKKHTLKTTVKNASNSYVFHTMVKEWVQEGWRVSLKKGKEEHVNGEEEEKNSFQLEPKQPLDVKEPSVKERKTKPPKHYTEGTLVTAMEHANDVGLGTPATRSSIVEKLKEVGYLREKGRNLLITHKGKVLIEMIRETGVRTLTSPALTTEWEGKLKAIEKGRESKEHFISGIKPFTSLMVEEFKKMEKRQLISDDDYFIACPSCKEGKIRETKKAYGCHRWKEGCSFTIWKRTYGNKTISKKQCMDLIKEGHTSYLTFTSKAGKKYKARLVLKDKQTGEIGMEFQNNSGDMSSKSKESVGVCPKCQKGEIVHRGKVYGCTGYPDCDFCIGTSIGGKTIEKEYVKMMIQGKETPLIQGFTSKNGRTYSAYLSLNTRYTLQFRFK